MPIPYLPPSGDTAAPSAASYNPGNPQLTAAGSVDTTGNNPYGGQLGAIGFYSNQGVADQASGAGLETSAPYKDYEKLGTMAQGYGQYAQNALNDPRAQAAVQQQMGMAMAGPTASQTTALGQLNLASQGNSATQLRNQAALSMLGQQARGAGPNAQAAGMQLGSDQAIQQMAAAAASGRGNNAAAFGGAQAGLASAQGANALQAAQQRSAAVQAAQQAYAGGAGQAVGTEVGAADQFGQAANQQSLTQAQIAQAAAASAQNQQQMAENYYTGQQAAYLGQQQQAGNMALAQGDQQQRLAAIAQQQDLAQQQFNMQMAGMVSSGVGSALGAF